MTALAEPPPRRRTAPPPVSGSSAESSSPPPGPVSPGTLLRGVSWAMYRAVRDDPGNDGLRMTYDRGSLEVVTISRPHERLSRLLYSFVTAWCQARGIAWDAAGSLTLRREPAARGLEPDECFFIRGLPAVCDRDDWDAGRDPPPDLAVEVVLSNPAIDKLPIYADLGVPEVWVWEGGVLTVRRLGGAGYATVGASEELAGFPLAAAAAGLRGGGAMSARIAEFTASLQAPPTA